MKELHEIPAKLETRARPDLDRVTEIARFMADTRSVLFLGRHVGYPVAMEGALKLKELAYIHAEGFAAGELKHGPIALIEPGQPVFVVVPSPSSEHGLHGKVVSNIQEIRARGARTLVIAEEGDEDVVPFADEVIRVPATPPLLAPLLTVVPLQVFALRAGHGQGPRRRPAAQPRQVGHGRVGPGARRDRRGRDRRRRRRAVRADPGAHAPACASGCSPTEERDLG